MEGRGGAAASEDKLLMLGEVAQLYYVGDLTQERIARRLGISRSGVSRMLKKARSLGMVEVKIHSPLGVVSDLQEEVRTRLGLLECRVLATAQRRASGRAPGNIGVFGARYLRGAISDGDVVGVGWSSAVHQVVNSGQLREKSDVTVAQMSGSVGGSVPDLDGASITVGLARALGAKAYLLQAPVLVADKAVREGLMRDRHIARTVEFGRRADVTVVGVGTIDHNCGQYRAGYLDDDDLEYIAGRGAVAEVCSSYLARDGSRVTVEMDARNVGLSFRDLRRVPTRIAMGWGANKAPANVSAARSGLINVLITDEDTAREMLEILDNGQ